MCEIRIYVCINMNTNVCSYLNVSVHDVFTCHTYRIVKRAYQHVNNFDMPKHARLTR
jgi:hypothetical protein